MNKTNVYELFYETLDPIIFPISQMLTELNKTVSDIDEIYFGLKVDRDDVDTYPPTVNLLMTTNGIVIDEPNGTIIIKVQDLDWNNLIKEETYELCFAIKFSGEDTMSEERISLTHNKKELKRIYIKPDSVRA